METSPINRSGDSSSLSKRVSTSRQSGEDAGQVSAAHSGTGGISSVVMLFAKASSEALGGNSKIWEDNDFPAAERENSSLAGKDGTSAATPDLLQRQYDYIGPFSGGMAAVRDRKRGKWGYINASLQEVISPETLKADGAGDFRGEYATVNIEGQLCFIDKTGKIVANFSEK